MSASCRHSTSPKARHRNLFHLRCRHLECWHFFLVAISSAAWDERSWSSGICISMCREGRWHWWDLCLQSWFTTYMRSYSHIHAFSRASKVDFNKVLELVLVSSPKSLRIGKNTSRAAEFYHDSVASPRDIYPRPLTTIGKPMSSTFDSTIPCPPSPDQ